MINSSSVRCAVSLCTAWHLRFPLAAQWPRLISQTHIRSFSLWKFLNVKSSGHNTHGIKAYTLFHPPPLPDRNVAVFSRHQQVETLPTSQIHAWLPLQKFLSPRQKEKSVWASSFKRDDPDLTTLEYELLDLKPQKVTPKQYLKPVANTLAELHFQFSSGLSHYTLLMRKAALFLEQGRIVEVHVRVPNGALPKTKARGVYMELQKDTADAAFRWFWATSPHLWPAVMLKAMPEGTYIKINPYHGRNELIWVFARTSKVGAKEPDESVTNVLAGIHPPELDYTPRIEKRRKEHLKWDEQGRGVPTKEVRRAFKLELKEKRSRGQEVPPEEVPVWYMEQKITTKRLKAMAEIKEVEKLIARQRRKAQRQKRKAVRYKESAEYGMVEGPQASEDSPELPFNVALSASAKRVVLPHHPEGARNEAESAHHDLERDLVLETKKVRRKSPQGIQTVRRKNAEPGAKASRLAAKHRSA